MPRNVRNFWIALDVDGRKTRIEAGPRAKDGGFVATVKMRDGEDITKAGQLVGWVECGDLRLEWIPEDESVGTLTLARFRR